MKIIYFGLLLANALMSQDVNVLELPNPTMISINSYIKNNYPKENMGNVYIVVSIPKQELYLIENSKIIKTYQISTAKNGVGNISGSNQTPTGMHKIVTKLGDNAEVGTIIRKGVVLEEKVEITAKPIKLNSDIITTRTMWISGLENGINKGGKVDSLTRGMMIHGTPEEGLIGTPASHGCIRLRNSEVIELYDLVPNGIKVLIENEF